MKQHRFSLRKHKLGVLSVVVGTVIFLGQGSAYANDLSATTLTNAISTELSSPKPDSVSEVVEDTEVLSVEVVSDVANHSVTESVSVEASSTGEPTAVATPTSLSSNDIVTVAPVWEKGYKGEGMLVAVIDSGIDIEHDVLRISDVTTAKYRSEEEMEAAKAAAGINYGKWYNNKVVFGYNYLDSNTELKEEDEDSHGMHVTGIAAGNPSKVDSTGERIYGVAPEAQVMFMRVFVDRSKTTDTPLYARAIEDAVKLGADSINLSLGSATGSLVNESPAVVEAIEKARRAGVTVVIAAGNDGAFGSEYANPSAANPDYGLVGSPSVAKDAISVASFNNSKLAVKVLDIVGAENIAELDYGKTSFTLPGTRDVEFDKDKEYEYLYAGLGKAEDVEKLDLTGKVALISRGEITFTEKITNALNKGAVGAVIFNNREDGDDLVMSLEGDAVKIPSVFIPMTVGEALSTASYKLHFNDRTVLKDNPNANQLSDFTSWGLTTDGELKPDVAAPGGAIYSSINNGKYASMNGTSMASPHVAGIALLVKQHLIKTYPEKSPAEIEALVKHLIMSTAKPHLNAETNAYTSPRQQGAGIADTKAAISTSLYLTGADDYSSVSLGNVKDTFSFDVLVHNFGNTDYTLTYETVVNTDGVADGKMTLLPRHLTTHVGKDLLVKANSTEKITVTVDASAFGKELTELMPNGYFLEGFVRFLDKASKDEVVSMPYVGFKGAFQNLPVIEVPIYDIIKEGKNGFYFEGDKEKQEIPKDAAYTGLVTSTKTSHQENNEDTSIIAVGSHETEDGTFVLMPKSDGGVVLAVSPNNDNYRDSLGFKGVFLRNFDDLVATVYAKDDVEHKNPLWQSEPKSGLKNYYSGRETNPKSSIIFASEWDGTDKDGNLLDDGEYAYVVTYYPMVPGADMQTMAFDVILDREAPAITTASYNKDNRHFIPRPVTETGSGVLRERLVYTVPAGTLEDGTEYPEYLAYIEKDEHGHFVIPEELELKDLTYLVEDHAGNRSEMSVEELAQVGNDSGRVFVKLVNQETNESSGYTFAYAVRDDKGQLVDGIDKSKDYIALPFGTYTVDLVLYDKDNSRLVGEASQVVTVSEKESIQTVSFAVTAIDYASLTVDFDKDLPSGTQVAVVDENGNTILLPAEKYSQSDFGKQVPVGHYNIAVTLAEGYEFYEDDLSVDVLEKKRNVKRLTLINKNVLKELFAQQEDVKTSAQYYNATTSSRTSYDSMLDAVKEALAGKRMQVELDALVEGLKQAQAKLDGKETDATALLAALDQQNEVRDMAIYYNASRPNQQAYDAAVRAGNLGRDSKTQAEVDELLAQLVAAQRGLDGQATNTNELKAAVEEGLALKENSDRYQYASEKVKEDYDKALGQAKTLLETAKLTQDEVNLALQNLKVAQEALDGQAPVLPVPSTELSQSLPSTKDDKKTTHLVTSVSNALVTGQEFVEDIKVTPVSPDLPTELGQQERFAKEEVMSEARQAHSEHTLPKTGDISALATTLLGMMSTSIALVMTKSRRKN